VAVALRAVGREHDRDRTRARPDGSLIEVAGRVPGPFEVHVTGPQQRDDDLERLLEPLIHVVLGQPERPCLAGPRVTSPEPQDEPAVADLVERLDRFRGDPWVTVQRGHDPRPDFDARGHGRYRTRDGHPLPEPARRLVGGPPQELVDAPHRVDAVPKRRTTFTQELRQYFPKGTDLSAYSQADLDAVATRLNARPRKTLEYETPAAMLAAIVASTP
jgi:hypothetical protein